MVPYEKSVSNLIFYCAHALPSDAADEWTKTHLLLIPLNTDKCSVTLMQIVIAHTIKPLISITTAYVGHHAISVLNCCTAVAICFRWLQQSIKN